jgi:hypothetical protein
MIYKKPRKFDSQPRVFLKAEHTFNIVQEMVINFR